MIKNWTLENFKSVQEKTKLEFAPLTIFTGANSSGKSTLIQSILLTAQTLQNSVYSKSVVLNGHILRLGSYDDIVSNGDSSNIITIGFNLEPSFAEDEFSRINYRKYYIRLPEKFSNIDCHFKFSVLSEKEEKEILQLQPKLEETFIKVSSQENNEYDEIHIIKTKTSLDKRIQELKLESNTLSNNEKNSLEFEVKKPNKLKEKRYYRLPKTLKLVGANLTHFLPSRLSGVYDSIDETNNQILDFFTSNEREIESHKDIIFNNEIIDFLMSIIKDSEKQLLENNNTKNKIKYDNLIENQTTENILNFLKNYLVSKILRSKFSEKREELEKLLKKEQKQKFTLEFIPFNDFGSDYIKYFFNESLKYLGPLRDEPKPVYPLSGVSNPSDIGFKGENTASVLDIHKKTHIKYIPTKMIEKDIISPNPVDSTLLDAVLDWLEYMGVASNVKTFDKGKLGHELKISTIGADSLHDLTHVGVGVSQVLPILVLSLLSEEDSTLIFEQPELHLHPKVQTRLADFFVSMSYLKKQCIVETHSEYLINRLRYQVALSNEDEISKNIIMYFVEKKEQNSVYKPVKINKYGVIEDWPKGFFDESEDIAGDMLKAGMEKRKREKRNG